MKKIFSVFFIFLAFIVTIGCFSNVKKNQAFADSSMPFESKCKSAYLCDSLNSTVIYSKNETKHLPIASMCKIMTLNLCFDQIENGNLSLDEEITISENASGMGGSQIFLECNANYKVSELIKGIVVASANDACVAIAERICGSEEAFVQKMNDKAKELNMEDTVFTNCTGLPKVGQYSCAKDVACMFSELLNHKDYFLFSKIWMDEIRHPKDRITEISNTNKLIRFYEGCDSGKTGYTSESGHCIAASAERNGTRLISVVISAPDSKTRFSEVKTMFNYGFANYVQKLVIDNKIPLDIPVKVSCGKSKNLEVIPEKPLYIFSHKEEKRGFEINFIPYENLKAPVIKGEKVGELEIYENNVLISTISVVANENIEVATYFDSIINVIDHWFLVG